jgi:hypothetical protein
LVAKTWISSGLRDIFYAFDKDDETFSYNNLFSEIMGLEKIIKAVLLHNSHEQYENKDYQEAKEIINDIAKQYGHDFKKMLKELSRIGISEIQNLKEHNFDGYLGKELIRAVKQGYMETRYPVPTPVSDSFPIKGTNLKHNPLWSSGISKFIYSICGACLEYLSKSMSLEDVWNGFQKNYRHKESLSRFNNLFWQLK